MTAPGLTIYGYDANDNLLSVHDQNNNPVERNVYDLRNRLTRKTDAKLLDTVFEYDGVGNITRMTDRRGRVTEFAYDVLSACPPSEFESRSPRFSRICWL